MSKIRDIFRTKPKYVTVKPTTSGREETTRNKAQVPDGLWTKCPQCSAVIYRKDLERNMGVCEKCEFHFPVGARERIQQLIDATVPFEELDADLVPGDPLGFPDYSSKKERDAKKTGLNDAIITGRAAIGGYPVVLGVMDFGFMGGSMGSVVGEKITRAFEHATQHCLPLILVSSSGGARMQEAIISLMQMQKTAAAVESHSRAGLLYISILTNPTTAGVYGSFASQGDINLAEPGATVGFAGRPVIEAATGKRVPPDLQKAETVYHNGFIDVVVSRTQLKALLERLLAIHSVRKTTVPVNTKTEPRLQSVDNQPYEIVSDEPIAADASVPTAPARRGLRRRRTTG